MGCFLNNPLLWTECLIIHLTSQNKCNNYTNLLKIRLIKIYFPNVRNKLSIYRVSQDAVNNKNDDPDSKKKQGYFI